MVKGWVDRGVLIKSVSALIGCGDVVAGRVYGCRIVKKVVLHAWPYILDTCHCSQQLIMHSASFAIADKSGQTTDIY